MTKYRIVERNRDEWGDYCLCPFYFLQVKIFDLFWIDYLKYPFAGSYVYGSSSYNLKVVENTYRKLMKKQEPVKQTVVKTFYDETT